MQLNMHMYYLQCVNGFWSIHIIRLNYGYIISRSQLMILWNKAFIDAFDQQIY